jgi:beta-lactamase superfamily II metal-dependent hydrolase
LPNIVRMGRVAVAMLALCLTFGSGAPAQNMQVHFIDVGQGAATLVQRIHFVLTVAALDRGGDEIGQSTVFGGSPLLA